MGLCGCADAPLMAIHIKVLKLNNTFTQKELEHELFAAITESMIYETISHNIMTSKTVI